MCILFCMCLDNVGDTHFACWYPLMFLCQPISSRYPRAEPVALYRSSKAWPECLFLPLLQHLSIQSLLSAIHTCPERIQEFSFTHGQSPWNSALRVNRRTTVHDCGNRCHRKPFCAIPKYMLHGVWSVLSSLNKQSSQGERFAKSVSFQSRLNNLAFRYRIMYALYLLSLISAGYRYLKP